MLEHRVHEDDRGWFTESWNQRTLAALGLECNFCQENHSVSAQWVLRGLHYQVVRPQGKLVRVLAGRIYDVVVDVRRASPDFGRWLGMTLSATELRSLWIPPGYAHGFLALLPGTEVLYACTDFYAPEHERTLRWDDPDLAIDWPLPPGVRPILSPKDAGGRLLRGAEVLA